MRLARRLRFASKALTVSLTISRTISLAFELPMRLLLAWSLHHENAGALQAREDALRGHAEIAASVLRAAHALALRTLAEVRYGGRKYFWVNDLQPRMLMRPIKPELDGQDLAGVKNPQGQLLFQAMVATVRASGAGFVGYQWPRPGRPAAVDKQSCVQGFEPWGWLVGTGVYGDDLAAAARSRLPAAGLVTGGARWGSKPTFTELLGKHGEFHRMAGNVAERINRGAMSEAVRLIG